MKAYLLYPSKDFDFEAPLPPHHEDLIGDLELTVLFKGMALGNPFLFEVAQRVVLASLHDTDTIRYRQDVLADCLAHPEVIRRMYALAVSALEEKRGFWSYTSRYPTSILSGAIHQLEAFLGWLRELRRIADENGERFQSRALQTLIRTLKRELDNEYFHTISSQLKQLKFRDGYLISMSLDSDNSGMNYVLRSSGGAKAGWKERIGLSPRRTYSFTIPPRDEAGADALSDMIGRGINLVANAAAQSADHIMSFFKMLLAELGFYVGCLNLYEQLIAKNRAISLPEPVLSDQVVLSFSNLLDTCLALKAEGQVVGNDVEADGKPLVIITGANSGGKSTFLRSVGLAQLMMQCGMFVTADMYRGGVCTAVFTHFIREEDPEMNRGRLDEELSRMSSIADDIRPGSWMLFNESFAATNEREGSEIGRQVVSALLEAKINVFFVTHRYDFAEGFRRKYAASTRFLRAQRHKDDGQCEFKLVVAEPLPTSFGEDVYRRVGGWFGEENPSGWLQRPMVADGLAPPEAVR